MVAALAETTGLTKKMHRTPKAVPESLHIARSDAKQNRPAQVVLRPALAPASGCTAFFMVPVVSATLRPPAKIYQPSGLRIDSAEVR